MKKLCKTILAASVAFGYTPIYAQQTLPVLTTPVTTMAPNRRIYVNNQWPAKNYKNLGRSTSNVLELSGACTPAQDQATSCPTPGGVTPGRWPGYSPLGTPGRNASGFRIFSFESHFGEDDPIIYPGQGGRSHCHVFFGNSSTSGVSTATSIRTTGNSTSAGGTANRSAYWVPCMVYVCDTLAKVAAGCTWTRNGEIIRPSLATGNNVYYKGHFGEELDHAPTRPAGYWLFNHDTEVLPVGFRMIAGCSACTPDAPATGGNDLGNSFTCIDAAQTEYPFKWIPGTGGTSACPATTFELKQIVRFPSCWNGTDLDSATHNTHIIGPSTTSDGSYTMVDVEDWFCPSTFPHVFPGVTYKVHYAYTSDADVKWWRLSSDNYDTSRPAGYSNHGDWFNGWDAAIMAEWVANCMVRGVDCHDNVIGPGVIDTTKWRVLQAPLGIAQ